MMVNKRAISRMQADVLALSGGVFFGLALRLIGQFTSRAERPEMAVPIRWVAREPI
jgi:hypothetical protein